MNSNVEDKQRNITTAIWYHKTTKHRFQAYAPSPGFLDWDSQPNPFRGYEGCKNFDLMFTRQKDQNKTHALSENTSSSFYIRLSKLLELSCGISAWKSTGIDSWALRHNPSSGNLHPTELYLILWDSDSDHLPAGCYHYNVYRHSLELRAEMSLSTAKSLKTALPGSFGLLGFSSILWREEWKYGSRAFRYCQLDVGHAIGAFHYSALTTGYDYELQPHLSDLQVGLLFNLEKNVQTEAEQEHPDCALLLFDENRNCSVEESAESTTKTRFLNEQLINEIVGGFDHWVGEPNRLSKEHACWKENQAVLKATYKKEVSAIDNYPILTKIKVNHTLLGDSAQDYESLIRQRRSAQRMQKNHSIDISTLNSILQPMVLDVSAEKAPLSTQKINFLIFVHNVDGLLPGLYLLHRTGQHEGDFASIFSEDLLNRTVIEGLPLYCIKTSDELSKTASKLFCHQAIAGHSCFSLMMIGEFLQPLKELGSWYYRQLHWEAGFLGQTLYLSAEAQGLNGTGIGCFFDDEVLTEAGLPLDLSWQSIYGFTIGKAQIDHRITNLPAYSHLGQSVKNRSCL